MTINERHDLIIKELDARGSVSVTDLSSILNVSEVTIRKDLTMLEQKNFLYRAHGKAIKINPYINDREHQGETEHRREDRHRQVRR